MKILVKLPCRERPQKLLQRIQEYQSLATDKGIQYLVSLDRNDPSCTSGYILGRLHALGCTVCIDNSHNKINAVNRDIEKADSWDILVLASDDMVCVQQGWDDIIKSDMVVNYPDTDGVLWYWDGDNATKGKLNTMCILGKKYYERFGYIYHPEYKSLWCDNEFMEVADMLGRQYKSETVLFKHVHFSNTPGLQPDKLMKRTQSLYTQDQQTFTKRKAENYGLLTK